MGSRTGARAKPVGRVVCAAPRSTKIVLKQRRDNAVSVRKAVEEGVHLRGVSQNARFCAATLRHFQVKRRRCRMACQPNGARLLPARAPPNAGSVCNWRLSPIVAVGLRLSRVGVFLIRIMFSCDGRSKRWRAIGAAPRLDLSDALRSGDAGVAPLCGAFWPYACSNLADSKLRD